MTSLLLALLLSSPQESVDDLLKSLHGKFRPCEDDVFAKLAKLGKSAVDAIETRLPGSKPDTRDWEHNNLLHALGHIGSDDALKLLRKYSTAREWLTRTPCYEAMGHIDRAEVRKSLTELLATEKDPTALGAVCSALAKLKEKGAVPGLLKVAEEAMMPAPFSALTALETLGDAATATELVRLYKDGKKDDEWMGPSFAAAAAALGSKEMEAELEKFLAGSKPASGIAATYFLARGDLRGAKSYLDDITGKDRESALWQYQTLKRRIPDLPEVATKGETLPVEDGKAVADWFEKNRARLVFDKEKKVYRLKK